MKRKAKNLLPRLVCLVLLLSLLASLATVFTAAETEEDSQTQDNFLKLVYNRAFDEGWGVDNGISLTPKGNSYSIDVERNELMEYNYFMRFSVEAGEDGYGQLNLPSHDGDGAVIEFDIMSDTGCDIGRIMYSRTVGQDNPTLFHVKENYLYAFAVSEENKMFDLTRGWGHVTVIYEYIADDLDANAVRISIYFEDEDGNARVLTQDHALANASDHLSFIRIGCPGGLAQSKYGTGYCIDNLKVYTGVTEAVEITEDMGYGSKVNANAAITENIISSDTQKSDYEYILEGVSMKIGVDWCLFKGDRRQIKVDDKGNIYGAPLKAEDGTVMVPLDVILELTGFPAYMHDDGMYIDISAENGASYICIGKDTATVNGEKIYLTAAPAVATDENGNSYVVVAMDDIEALFPGYFVTFDEMGLIIICELDEVVNRYEHLTTLTGLMKLFVFDNPSPEQVYEDLKKGTNNFDHPYLFSSQADLDAMRDAYLLTEDDEGYDPTYWSLLNKHVKAAESSYKRFSLPNEDGTYTTYVGENPDARPVMPYQESGGYDPDGGRSSPDSYTGHLQNFAAGWAITRDDKYLYAAYDLAVAMGEWLHWGSGHFLNCADASAPYALYYDWTYDRNKELGLDTDVLAEILFRQGVNQGWRSSMFLPLDHYRKQGNASNYTDRNNNWVAVCVSGMVESSFVLMDIEEYREKASWLVSDNLFHMSDTGLTHYAPDGAYIEGPGYWAYGTNNFFELCYVLDHAVGTNYGLMNGWGVDTTSYYALHIESNEYRSFNYHDGSMGSVPSTWFFYVGEYFNDPGLVSIRFDHINTGKGSNIADMISYPKNFEATAEPELALDYYAAGIDIYTARSGWDKGSMFVGIHGGNNNVTHGQVDAGCFVYHNAGNVWFIDMGTENYNCYGFWGGGSRYRYYRMKPEGNNTIALTSSPSKVPYGQVADSIAESFDRVYNEYGSSVKIDMTPTLGGLATTATRGLLVTNDRETVVIQDEISFGGIQSIYWFGHYQSTYVTDVRLTADKKTAYMSDKNGNVLRATIVSPVKTFQWTMMDSYTFVHTDPDSGTYDDEYSLSNGTGVPQNDRSQFFKLAIKGTDVLSFNVAVVLELVDVEHEIEVGYKWTDMDNWVPGPDQRGELVIVESKLRNIPKKADVRAGIVKLSRSFVDGVMSSDIINEVYRAITDVAYTESYYEGELGDDYDEPLASYSEYKSKYEAYLNGVNVNVNSSKDFVSLLAGR